MLLYILHKDRLGDYKKTFCVLASAMPFCFMKKYFRRELWKKLMKKNTHSRTMTWM